MEQGNHQPEQEASPGIKRASETSGIPASFMERIMRLNELLKNEADELRGLYDSGNKEAAYEQVDELADSLMQEDAEYINNLTELRAMRSSSRTGGERETAIVQRQKELRDNYYQLIILETGLPDESTATQFEQAKEAIHTLLEERGFDGQNTAEALDILGITTKKDDDTLTYHYPSDLLPSSVNDKWGIYLCSVIKHSRSVDALEHGKGGLQEDVEAADKARVYAHDAVTRDVHTILGLSWDIKSTRGLLGHIRDAVLPNEQSLHDSHSDELLAHYSSGVAVSAVLAAKPHH